jgi:hypothetical protein
MAAVMVVLAYLLALHQWAAAVLVVMRVLEVLGVLVRLVLLVQAALAAAAGLEIVLTIQVAVAVALVCLDRGLVALVGLKGWHRQIVAVMAAVAVLAEILVAGVAHQIVALLHRAEHMAAVAAAAVFLAPAALVGLAQFVLCGSAHLVAFHQLVQAHLNF